MKKRLIALLVFTVILIMPNNAKALENGQYTISSLSKGDYALDLNGASSKNGSNVQIYSYNNTNAQKWNIEKLSNGYYKIETVIEKGKVLDVTGANSANGTNVQIYKSNNTAAQQWIIRENSNGYYNIISKIKNMYLDISGGKLANYSNIQIYKGNGTNAQLFNFEKVGAKENITNNEYEIASASNSNFSIDLNGASTKNSENIQLYKTNNSLAQQWKVQKLNNGFYIIKSTIDENKVLDVKSGSGINNRNVQLYQYNGTMAQQWYFKKTASGNYNIVSRLNNKYLNINNNSLKNYSNIEILYKNNSSSQEFKLKKVEEAINIANGKYIIKNFKDQNYVIDLTGAKTSNNTNVQIYKRNNTIAQQWNIVKQNDGYYKIETVKDSQMLLDVTGAKTTNGTNIQIYKNNNNAAQRWKFTKFTDGSYGIVSKLGKYIDISSGKLSNGSNVQLYQRNKTYAQKFILEKVEDKPVVVPTEPPKEPEEPKKDPEYATPEVEKDSNFTNLIIFTKFSDDDKDIFNATYDAGSYQRNNWNEIKEMYNGKLSVSGTEQSFKNYIKTVTNNKVRVNNVFLQEKYKKDKVVTFTLKNTRSSYTDGDSIVSEIIEGIKSGNINNELGTIKLDNLESEVLDCLTVVVQGKADARDDLLTSHKTVYSGTNKINSSYVRNYVLLSSSSLVEDDGSISSSQQQGVISHEFLHVLGLPDLYRNTGSGQPVGPWDIMAQTSPFLQYPLGYLRARQNWIRSKNITTSGTYTIDAISSSGDNQVFILKTPLNDSEKIVVEYRKQSTSMGDIESKIPSSGLIIYRVDDKVDNLSNFLGQNYIYVYRPNITDMQSAADVGETGQNKVYEAALDPNKNQTYGSTDLNASWKNNTIYYSDGQNSGIKISNLKYSLDKTKITFNIDFADYQNEDLWENLGTISNDISDKNNLYNDNEINSLYSVYTESSNKTFTKKYQNNTWSQIGNILTSIESGKVIKYSNDLYLIGRDITKYNVVLYKLVNNTWTKLNTFGTDYAQDYGMTIDNNKLYLYYYLGNELSVYNAITKELVTTKIISNNFSNPILEVMNNKIFITYSDFTGTNPYGVIDSYDILNKVWKSEVTSTLKNSNTHDIKKIGNKIYSFIGITGTNPTIYIYDGTSWSSKTIKTMTNYLDVSLNILSNKILLTYISGNNTITLDVTNEEEIIVDEKLGTNLAAVSTISNNKDTLFATTNPKNTSTFTVKQKVIK